MIEAVMPEGVEHNLVYRCEFFRAGHVIEAVMPEGVEHALLAKRVERKLE